MNQAVETQPIKYLAENRDFYHVIQQSLSIRRHIEIFLWLNGELQRFMPHDVLVLAWGDFAIGALHFDVISALPGVRTHLFRAGELAPLARSFHSAWLARGATPFTIEQDDGFFGEAAGLSPPLRALKSMKAAVVHGLHDARMNSTYVYFGLSMTKWDAPTQVRAAIEFILPHLDVALRRLAPLLSEANSSATINRLSEVVRSSPSAKIPNLGLSPRECEVMSWVRMGKTNQEIGRILNISTFTVKNHLQRVFKKLDVLNRAQAVANMSDEKRRPRAA